MLGSNMHPVVVGFCVFKTKIVETQDMLSYNSFCILLHQLYCLFQTISFIFAYNTCIWGKKVRSFFIIVILKCRLPVSSSGHLIIKQKNIWPLNWIGPIKAQRTVASDGDGRQEGVMTLTKVTCFKFSSG